MKMLQTAAKEKLTPQQLSNGTCRASRHGERLNCSNDEFIRTTKSATTARRSASGSGWRLRGRLSRQIFGLVLVRDEAYYDEDETRLNEQGERVGPQGTPVEWVRRRAISFKLSLTSRSCSISTLGIPTTCCRRRLNEVVAFVKAACRTLDLAHDVRWGARSSNPGT